MKRFCAGVGTCLWAAGALAASLLPPGTYTGTGHWKMPDGSVGQYKVETVIDSDTVTSRYEYVREGRNSNETHVIKLVPKDEALFDVRDETGVVGQGYWYGTECFYRAELGGMAVEESMRFAAGELHKFGSKGGQGFRVVWKEVLQAN